MAAGLSTNPSGVRNTIVSSLEMGTVAGYVVITPARNEAQFIELTIKSVVAQTIRPVKWVIVSDGSTDGTDEIVRRYTLQYPWIELLRMPERKERHFAGKVHAFNAGLAIVADLQFEIIVSLDADISFDADYFSYLLEKLHSDPKLGIVGTPFFDGPNGVYDYRFVNIEHVSGACQVFRRSCFEEIGGYQPMKGGGIDYLAVLTARMKGWKTRTFTVKVCNHHREMGTAQKGILQAKFKYGVKDYEFGNHPIWEIARSLYQIQKRPFVIGGFALLVGYLWAFLKNEQGAVPHQVKRFVRREQMARLYKLPAIQRILPNTIGAER
jgi:glycosyltransferase involved in cell wall biosynthesis